MINSSEAIVIAFQSYQTGNLSQAELICHQILQQQPDSTEALDMLGMIAHQLGKLNEAIAYYRQLLALMPDYAEIYYRLGSALHSSGQLADAIAYYQQAIALKPNYTDAHYDLGYALQEQGNLPAAIEHYQQAIALNPNDAEAHGNLANALLEQGQIEAAIAHYQNAIALRPNVPGIYYNLGNAFRQQNQLEAAITQFRRAIALDPTYVDAYLQLATVLHSLGQRQEAIFYYQQVIFLKPNLADVYYKLGNAFLEQSRYSEAIIQYQQALALEPHLLDAYIKLGCALIFQLQLEEATAYFHQALILHPDLPEAYHNLGVAFVNQGKVDEAIDCFQKALQLKPDLVEAYWYSQLILPILYDSQEQIPFWRQRFCQRLNDLIQQTALDTPENRKQALRPLEKSAFTFYLGYQGLNDRGLQRKYGSFVHRVMAANFPQWTSPLPMPPLSNPNFSQANRFSGGEVGKLGTPLEVGEVFSPSSPSSLSSPLSPSSSMPVGEKSGSNTHKIRVGYLSAHFRSHTVAMLTLGWLKNCDKQKFEIYSYHIDPKSDLITQKFRSFSDGFYHIYGSLESVCKQVIADKLHILVFTDISMNAPTTQLGGLRLAPVQCTTWGHPVTSGLPTIDYFLSSELMEPENAQDHYCEKLIRLPNIGICYAKPSIPKPTRTRSTFHLREDTVIYLSCQSLYKYLPQFDYIFAQIAQRVPQAQFAFISSHTTAITAQFQSRLRRAFAKLGLDSENYCVVVPRLEQVDYINLNLVSDIFLDTFSWSGGNTTLEAIACGLPVVTCPGEFMRSRHAYGILKMMGMTETIAQDEAEYVEIAVRLGLDADWRQEIVRKISERHSLLYDDTTCVTALESFYKNVVLPLVPNP